MSYYYYYYYSSYISKFKAKNFFVWKEPPLLPSNAGKNSSTASVDRVSFLLASAPAAVPQMCVDCVPA
jgi:hypothetical protein